MKKKMIARRLAGTILAAALTLGGLVAAGTLGGHHDTDQSDEVAGVSWNIVVKLPGKGGVSTQGSTWS